MDPITDEHFSWIAESSAVTAKTINSKDFNPKRADGINKLLLKDVSDGKFYYAPEHLVVCLEHGIWKYCVGNNEYLIGDKFFEQTTAHWTRQYNFVLLSICYSSRAHQQLTRDTTKKIKLQGEFTPKDLEEMVKDSRKLIDCSCGLKGVTSCPISLLEPDGY